MDKIDRINFFLERMGKRSGARRPRELRDWRGCVELEGTTELRGRARGRGGASEQVAGAQGRNAQGRCSGGEVGGAA